MTNSESAYRQVWGWMVATLVGGLIVRILGFAALHRALFCGIPSFEDAVHHLRILQILGGGLLEQGLPWGSPIYPQAAALVIRLFGQELPVLFGAQAVLGMLSVLILVWALAPVLSLRDRWIAAFLYAIHPIGVFFEMRLHPAAFAIPLLLLVLRWVFFSQGRGAGVAALGGLACGLGFLLRPTEFIALAVAGIWKHLRKGRADWSAAVALLVGFLLLPALVVFHNSTLDRGGPTWNWSSAVAFHRTLQPETWGTARSVDPPAWKDPGRARSQANEVAARELSEWEMTLLFSENAVRTLIERPLSFLRSVTQRAVLLLSRHEMPDPVSPGYVLGQYAPALRWGLWLFPLLLGLGALGLWNLRERQAIGWILPPLAGLIAANLLGIHSCTSRWLLVIALLPACAIGLMSIAPYVARLRAGEGARWVLPATVALLILSALDLPGAAPRLDNASEDLRMEANLVLQAGDKTGAQARLQRALAVDPNNPMVHADLAGLLTQQELPGAAQSEYERALELSPNNEAALYGLSELLRRRGEAAQAESVAVRLISLHPNHPLYLNQFGAIAMMSGKFEIARTALRRALEISPDYQVALHNLRQADRAEQGATGLAFPEGVELHEDLMEWGKQALVAFQQERLADADSLTALSLERYPDHVVALYFRGGFLLRSGRASEAADLLVRAVRNTAGYVMTTQLAADALVASDRLEEAISVVELSLEEAPDQRNRLGLERLLSRLRDMRYD